jgi:hypothetical protein
VADGKEVRSVGNSQVLKDTALVEAFNLKAAIEYSLKQPDKAKQDLASMPPRWVMKGADGGDGEGGNGMAGMDMVEI